MDFIIQKLSIDIRMIPTRQMGKNMNSKVIKVEVVFFSNILDSQF